MNDNRRYSNAGKAALNQIQAVLSVAFLAFFLFVAFRNVPIATVWEAITHANIYIVAGVFLLGAVPPLITALRWRIFIARHSTCLSLLELYKLTLIMTGLNCVVPRAGDLFVPPLVSRTTRLSLPKLYGTLAGIRILDGLALLLALALALAIQGTVIQEALPHLPIPFLMVCLITLVLLVPITWLILTTSPTIRKAIASIVNKLPSSVALRVNRVADAFHSGMHAGQSPGTYVMLGLYGIASWVFSVLPTYFLFYAFPFQYHLHLGISDALLTSVVALLGAYVIQTPSAAGVAHSTIRFSLATFAGVTTEDALAYATILHACGFVFNVAIGGLLMVLENRRPPSMSSTADTGGTTRA